MKTRRYDYEIKFKRGIGGAGVFGNSVRRVSKNDRIQVRAGRVFLGTCYGQHKGSEAQSNPKLRRVLEPAPVASPASL